MVWIEGNIIIEELQMKEKIKQLEQALVNSELQLLGKFLFYKEL